MDDGSAAKAFLDEAEKVLRTEYLPQCPDLVLWRGQKDHDLGDLILNVETIVVCMSDDQSGKTAPTIVLMEVWAHLNARVQFEHDPDEVQNWTTGFGGIGEMSIVREAAHYLMDFRS